MNQELKSKSVVLDDVRWTLNQDAQGLMEYALIIILVAVIVLVVLAIFGPGVGNMYSNVINNI
jgi:pilus assembly protein Flp/PilA